EITTPVPGGNLEVKPTMTLVAMAGAEAEVGRLAFSADVRRDTARMRLLSAPDAGEIETSSIGMTGLAGVRFELGPILASPLGGVSYDISSTRAPSELSGSSMPSWNRVLVLAGGTIGYGGLGEPGLVAQLAILAIPFGIHEEQPLTSGQSSSVLGARGWLRLRYQLPDLLGRAGGLFAELAVHGEMLEIEYRGTGTRTVSGTDTAVKDAVESRTTLWTTASVGWVF
ncbi:hypothetical protein ACFL6C_10890, partial [Myxococcota bacterium]